MTAMWVETVQHPTNAFWTCDAPVPAVGETLTIERPAPAWTEPGPAGQWVTERPPALVCSSCGHDLEPIDQQLVETAETPPGA